MRPLLTALVLAFVTLGHASWGLGQQALILVRHADRLDDSTDSPLSKAGEERAQRLAQLLKDGGITAIYTSEFQRTQKTAEPLAAALKITAVIVPVMDREGLLNHLRTNHPDGIVLVVGHDRSVPNLLKALGHSVTVIIGPKEYDNLIVVVPKTGGAPTVVRLRY